jgi:hypothetical protein
MPSPVAHIYTARAETRSGILVAEVGFVLGIREEAPLHVSARANMALGSYVFNISFHFDSFLQVFIMVLYECLLRE